jgi:hypothetical protein
MSTLATGCGCSKNYRCAGLSCTIEGSARSVVALGNSGERWKRLLMFIGPDNHRLIVYRLSDRILTS